MLEKGFVIQRLAFFDDGQFVDAVGHSFGGGDVQIRGVISSVSPAKACGFPHQVEGDQEQELDQMQPNE